MASTFIAVVLILSCGLLGGYASHGLAYQHGYFDAIKDCLRVAHGVAAPGTECVLVQDHVYYRTAFTGIKKVDNLFSVLFEFFAYGLSKNAKDVGKIDYEALMGSTYMAILFFGAWYLMAMEGLRKKNEGRITSYTGVFGAIFQLATITITAPIYLTLQILGLSSPQDYDTVAVDSLDLSILPWVTTISYIIPTVGLTLPILNIFSPKINYIAIALWQPFPIYQAILHPVFRFICGGKSQGKGKQSPEKLERNLGSAYRFVLFVCMGVHLIVVGSLLLNFTGLGQGLIPELSATRILAPTSLTHPPTLAMIDTPVSAEASRTIVMGFLRWDIYCTSAAYVFWAAYLAYRADKGPGFVAILEKIMFWTVVGGPISTATVLLWERDAAVLKKVRATQVSSKRK